MSVRPRTPTVDDLRVRMCYICREEERHDAPENPPRAWTHPCACTLIAHESCLLHWIHTSQTDRTRSKNALKCPQCGYKYELVSERPRLLKVLDGGNRVMSFVGRLIAVGTLGGVVFGVGTGVYIISTAYGAYALRQFIGKEMYDLLLTDDPSLWPWHSFLNLPLIPLSLIFSRTSLTSPLLPVIPILLTWPTSTPIQPRETGLINYWLNNPSGGSRELELPKVRLLGWPPSPMLVGLFLMPAARALWRRWFGRFSAWVLGIKEGERNRRIGNDADGGRGRGRRERNGNGGEGGRRFEWALNGPFQMQIGAEIEHEVGERRMQVQAPQPPREPDVVPAEGRDDNNQAGPNANQNQGVNNGNNNNAGAEGEGEEDAAELAARTIRISGSSLGRLIGGALLLPAISSFMGSLLLRLSHHSPILKHFLAVRPPIGLGGFYPPPPLGAFSLGGVAWEQLSLVRKLSVMVRVVLGAVWSGTRTWAECDPVWWRNSIGLGIFVAAKDCVSLLHLYLKKRELETRRVKSRPFHGVDVRELDLAFPLRFRD